MKLSNEITDLLEEKKIKLDNGELLTVKEIQDRINKTIKNMGRDFKKIDDLIKNNPVGKNLSPDDPMVRGLSKDNLRRVNLIMKLNSFLDKKDRININ